MPVSGKSLPNVETIAVTGDIAIDHFEMAIPPEIPEYNWQHYHYINHHSMPGGALLLAQFVQSACGQPVVAPDLADIRAFSSSRLVHSYARCQKASRATHHTASGREMYRIAENLGYAGPVDRASALPWNNGGKEFRLVVLDDAGNGFRDEIQAWPLSIRESSQQPLVLLKMNQPLARGRLWQELRQNHADRLAVIINADHLRHEGINISRRLSWERTALDFARHLDLHPKLAVLGKSAALIVRLGLDGAILYTHNGETRNARLFYDPNMGEDDFQARHPGSMNGTGSAFAAAVAASMASSGYPETLEIFANLETGIRRGIISQRRLWQQGFRYEAGQLEYPLEEIFSPDSSGTISIADVAIPLDNPVQAKNRSYWSILTDQNQAAIEELAFEYVKRGPKHTLTSVPAGQFGALRTYDRSEIESYRSIANLITEYLSLAKINKPLSVAVFGAPGSGKSFGVTEIAESIAPGQLERLEFNLSEFAAEKDLVSAFHTVRDVVLAGQTPLVFFDEFDSSLDGRPLGWLKFFLAPMQNGRFRDGETVHPLGKSIFVFAGGVFHSLEDFSQADSTSGPNIPGYEFKAAKIPDFISRLRGFVNIKGPNPPPGETNGLFMIRRALMLRTQLQKSAPHLFYSDGQISIDEGLLRALIQTGEFKHGTRSMAAIIDMSMLSGRRSFEQAALPSREQLELHVDADTFCHLMEISESSGTGE